MPLPRANIQINVQIYISKFLNSILNILNKILKTLKNYREKMGVHVNVCMSKFMRTPIKVGVCTHATCTNCQTLMIAAGERTDHCKIQSTSLSPDEIPDLLSLLKKIAPRKTKVKHITQVCG